MSLIGPIGRCHTCGHDPRLITFRAPQEPQLRTPREVKAFTDGDEVMQSLKPRPEFDYGKFMVRIKMLTTVLHQLYAKSEYKWISEYANEAEARIEQLEKELSESRRHRSPLTPYGEEIVSQLVSHRNDVYAAALEADAVGEPDEAHEITETASMLDQVIKWLAPDSDIQKLTDEAFASDEEIMRNLEGQKP